MYKKRPFGEKLNASFDFIKENWKIILKFVTYLILPLCLVQALSLNGLMGGAFNMMQMGEHNVLGAGELAGVGMTLFMHYSAYILLSMLGMILITSLIYGLIRSYNEREERLQGLTLGMLKPMLLHNMKRMLILILLCFLFVILVVTVTAALAILSLYTLFLTFPLIIAIIVPLALLAPIYLFEDVSIIDAFKKTFRLGFATWGGVFLISLIMGIIANILQGVTMMPWYIATLVKYFFAMSDGGSTATVSVGYSFFLYLLGIIQTFGIYLSMIFSLVGMAYQYGHASEVVDSVTVESDIDNFDKL